MVGFGSIGAQRRPETNCPENRGRRSRSGRLRGFRAIYDDVVAHWRKVFMKDPRRKTTGSVPGVTAPGPRWLESFAPCAQPVPLTSPVTRCDTGDSGVETVRADRKVWRGAAIGRPIATFGPDQPGRPLLAALSHVLRDFLFAGHRGRRDFGASIGRGPSCRIWRQRGRHSPRGGSPAWLTCRLDEPLSGNGEGVRSRKIGKTRRSSSFAQAESDGGGENSSSSKRAGDHGNGFF